jgi:hypothetical protein
MRSSIKMADLAKRATTKTQRLGRDPSALLFYLPQEHDIICTPNGSTGSSESNGKEATFCPLIGKNHVKGSCNHDERFMSNRTPSEYQTSLSDELRE